MPRYSSLVSIFWAYQGVFAAATDVATAAVIAYGKVEGVEEHALLQTGILGRMLQIIVFQGVGWCMLNRADCDLPALAPSLDMSLLNPFGACTKT